MTFLLSFAFRAVRPDGSLDTGVIDAPDREAAVTLLGDRGLFPVEVRSHTHSGARQARVGALDLALGLRALATLLSAGLPISRAVPLLADSAPVSWAPVLPEIRRRIEQGESLGDALERSGLPLPPHAIGVVRAGEAGSGLAGAVDRAAGALEERADARAELRKALSYPLLLMTTGLACVALLVGVVLPRFVSLLTETGQALPATTRIVLGLGALGRPALLVALVLAPAGVIGWRIYHSRPGLRRRGHSLLLRLPWVGPIRAASASSNACSALAALLDSGVPIAAALPEAARATGDAAVETRLAAVRDRLIVGEPLSTALAAEDALSSWAIRLVRVGEETGELASMLDHAARMGSRDALRRLHTLLRFVEPSMILAFGTVVMLVAAALLQAMYGLRPAP